MPTPPYRGHQMSPRVEDASDRARQLAAARRWKTAGAVISALYVGWLAYLWYDEPPDDLEGYFAVATGLVCGVGLFAGIPWLVGSTKQRRAGERLYLNGTELTIVGLVRGAPNVFDLTLTRAEVRLAGMLPDKLVNPSEKDLRYARNRRLQEQMDKFIDDGVEVSLFRPVLVLFRPADDHEFVIELSHRETRRMRPAAEILMLEGAMRFATDPGIQLAAGRLRTVARWTRLPVIYEAAADAIPATPADDVSGTVLRTPVDRGLPAPEIEIRS